MSYRPVPNRTDGSMSVETFTRIVDELPELESIQLQGLAEPLLKPDVFEMIRLRDRARHRHRVQHERDRLTQARGERLIRNGLGWLRGVWIDAATAETYEAIRGGRFDRVCENVSVFADTKRRLHATNPELELVFVAMRRNVAELPGLVRMAAGWAIDRIHVQNLSHSFEDTDGLTGCREIRRFTSAEALFRGGR